MPPRILRTHGPQAGVQHALPFLTALKRKRRLSAPLLPSGPAALPCAIFDRRVYSKVSWRKHGFPKAQVEVEVEVEVSEILRSSRTWRRTLQRLDEAESSGPIRLLSR